MHKLLKSALIVTIFSVATRALGFVLRIILSRGLGAETLGYYQVAMSIFGVLMTLVASGIPLVVSRSFAYNKSIGNNKAAFSSVSSGLILALTISCIISLIIYLFPNIINSLFNNEQATKIVVFSLPALIASAIYCVLRGALWGDKHFFAISFTEFFEQVIRIILCFILFYTPVLQSLTMGEKAATSLSLACIASCILVVAIYFILKQKLLKPKTTFKRVLKSSMPITTLRSISSLVQSFIALIIPARLMLYGYSSSEAMAQYGMLMGMALPLIMIPGTLIGSLAVTLVPEISSKTDNIDDKSRIKDFSGLKRNVAVGINSSVLISSIFIPAFMVLGQPICQILFGSAEAGIYVSYAAIIILPMGINQITSSILNSIGLEFKSLISYVLGAIALFLCIFFLPKYMGTNALILGLGLLNTIASTINIIMLSKRNLINKNLIKFIGFSLIFIIVSTILGKLSFNLLDKFLPTIISTIIIGILCVLSMISLYYVFNISNIKTIFVSKCNKHKKTAI